MNFDPDHRSGADHYRCAEQYIAAAGDHFADSTRRDQPPYERTESAQKCRALTDMAIAHGLLAVAAAAALPTAARFLGDSPAITDMAHAIGWPNHTDAPSNACAPEPTQPATPAVPTKVKIAEHLQRMANNYPANVFTEEGTHPTPSPAPPCGPCSHRKPTGCCARSTPRPKKPTGCYARSTPRFDPSAASPRAVQRCRSPPTNPARSSPTNTSPTKPEGTTP
jgi:hypothetical protein